MTPVTPEPLADSFDSPDGRTYSGPVSAATPGQADDHVGTIENTETGTTWVSWDRRMTPAWPEIASAVLRLSAGAVVLREGVDVDGSEEPDRVFVVIERALAAQDARPAPGDVLDITGEVLTAAVQGKRIMLQLGSKPGPQPAPELAEAIRAYCQQEAAEFSAEMFPVRPQDMRVSAGDILAIVDRVQPATAAPELAAAMAESKRYREALEKVAGGEVGKGIADLRKIAVRALEGK